MNIEDGQVYSGFFLLDSSSCSQNINKQTVNIAGENLMDNSFH